MALETEPLHTEREDLLSREMVAAGVLPVGCTIMTGMAGTVTSRRELEGAALALTALVAETGAFGGIDVAPGDILYVATKATAAAQRARLAQAVPCEPENNVLWCEWRGRVDLAFADELGETLAATGARIAVIDSAAAGLGTRQKERTVVAELSRVAKEAGAAVVLLYPLTQKNLLDVRDPSTGLAAAADAVWELYRGQRGERTVFASAAGGCMAVGLPAAPPTRSMAAGTAAEAERAADAVNGGEGGEIAGANEGGTEEEGL